MSGKGWIRIDRKLEDHWLWTDKPFSRGQAWIDLIILAKHKDQNFFSSGTKIVEGKRGCVYRSIQSLAERWGWERKKVSGFLRLLSRDGMVVTESTTHGTTITIVNYDNYQDCVTTESTTESTTGWTTDGQPKGQPWDNRGTTVGQPFPTYKNDNNENNENNIGIEYIYTSMAEAVGAAPIPSKNDIDRIVDAWNQIPHAIRLSSIVPMTRRYDKLREAMAIVGIDGVMQAIQSVKDSDWLKEQGHVAFDRWITPNRIQSLIEGQYQEKFEKKDDGQKGGADYGLARDW